MQRFLSKPGNREKARLYQAARRQTEAGKQYDRDRQRRRRADPVEAVACRLRGRMREALKAQGVRKSRKLFELVGCDLQTLREHLLSTAPAGFTWEMFDSSWHVDHMKPLRGFDLSDPKQLADACHYTNLRILPALENHQKSDTLPDGTRARNLMR